MSLIKKHIKLKESSDFFYISQSNISKKFYEFETTINIFSHRLISYNGKIETDQVMPNFVSFVSHLHLKTLSTY